MRVLFIGNSHTYFNDMPQTFAELWQSAFNEKPDITMLAYSNRPLQWHSNEYFTIRFNLLYGNYDVCIIQQSAHPFPGYDETLIGIETIIRLCNIANVKPYLYMPWCEQRFPENQEKITSALKKIASEKNIGSLPVGDVWQEFQKRNSNIDLYWKDGEHASIIGDYLIAVTMCIVISGTSDITFSDSARDFLLGNDLDFNNPIVCEDINKIKYKIPLGIINDIVDSAKTILHI